MTGVLPEQAKVETLARFTDSGPGHINCAQALVHYALLVSGEDLDPVTVARYMGGGLAGTGGTCGAITGTALALGLRDSRLQADDPELRLQTTDHLREHIREFTEKFGARQCLDLTGFDLTSPEEREVFMQSEARRRCADYVGYMCDRLKPLLTDPTAGS